MKAKIVSLGSGYNECQHKGQKKKKKTFRNLKITQMIIVQELKLTLKMKKEKTEVKVRSEA